MGQMYAKLSNNCANFSHCSLDWPLLDSHWMTSDPATVVNSNSFFVIPIVISLLPVNGITLSSLLVAAGSILVLTSELLGLEVEGELPIETLSEVSVPGGDSAFEPRPVRPLFWAVMPESGCRIFIIQPSSSCSTALMSLGLTWKRSVSPTLATVSFRSWH